MRKSNRTRRGFTLVELLVAAALSLVIMGIIAQAFRLSIDTFRSLRAVAQLQDKLRSAENVIRRDLAAEHFGGNFHTGYSGPYLRDQRLDLVGWMPPDQGYFEIQQGSIGTWEGQDSDGLWSTHATDHKLRFTVHLNGKREEEWFYAYPPNPGPGFPATVTNAPNGDPNFNRNGGVAVRWAEVCYFLVSNGQTANGTPLFALHRKQLGLLPNAANVGNANQVSTDLSRTGATYNTPATVTNPANRITLASLGNGDDILMTDVLSFEVKVFWDTGAASLAANGTRAVRKFPAASIADLIVYPGAAGQVQNLDYPFDVLPSIPKWVGMRFDTMYKPPQIVPATTIDWDNPTSFQLNNANLPLNRIRVNTLQIRLRIWDFNTQTSRQITIVQDI